MRNAKPLTRKGRGDVGVAEQGETSVYTVQELRKRRKWISILVCISLAMVAGMAIVPIIMLRNSSEQASPEVRPDGVGWSPPPEPPPFPAVEDLPHIRFDVDLTYDYTLRL